jgi:hypothetical protein
MVRAAAVRAAATSTEQKPRRLAFHEYLPFQHNHNLIKTLK